MDDERSRLIEELEQLRARVEEIGRRLAELDQPTRERVRLKLLKGGAAAAAGILVAAVWLRNHPLALAAAPATLIAAAVLLLPSKTNDYGDSPPTRPTSAPALTPPPSHPSSEPPLVAPTG